MPLTYIVSSVPFSTVGPRPRRLGVHDYAADAGDKGEHERDEMVLEDGDAAVAGSHEMEILSPT